MYKVYEGEDEPSKKLKGVMLMLYDKDVNVEKEGMKATHEKDGAMEKIKRNIVPAMVGAVLGAGLCAGVNKVRGSKKNDDVIE